MILVYLQIEKMKSFKTKCNAENIIAKFEEKGRLRKIMNYGHVEIKVIQIKKSKKKVIGEK